MILDCGDPRWDEYCEKMPIEKQDIYFTSQYYQMEQERQGGEGKLFVYEDEKGNIGLYPFIKREIIHPDLGEQYYDIQTAYGYGGPIVKEDKLDFIREFEHAFLQFCEQEKIVAEFVRFHPLLSNEHIFCEDIQVLMRRNTVWIDLEAEIDEIWMHEISTQNRNTIRKCIKNGLKVQEEHDYSKFIELYVNTMEKVGAREFYFFRQPYFTHMEKNDGYTLFEVKLGDKTLAAAVFMEHGNYFHYHLAGSDKNYLKLAPNNILIWEAIKYAKEQGYKKMHLGGGLSGSMEDNLFRFKRRFSSNYSEFYVGERIHNREIYNILINDWEKKHEQKISWILQYRE